MSILLGMVRAAELESCLDNGINILFASDLKDYFRQFEECLVNTDILWTKPSEMVFYAALGLPLLLAPPVGGHEHANRNWLLSHAAAFDAGNPSALGHRLENLLTTGEFCDLAMNAYSRLDRDGSDRIFKIVASAIHSDLKPHSFVPPRY
jgi:hypothetical protein